MILPLSKSFQALKKRLQCVSIINDDENFKMDAQENSRFFGDVHVLEGEMSIENCLRIFDEK